MSNDRLKFRAWDEENETMVYVGDGDPYVFCMLEDSSLELRTFFDEAGYVPVDSEFMQWTGLYDCEGKEIYESDLVDAQWDSDEPEIFVVEWGLQGFIPSDFPLSDSKIVGNIYENPELLDA